MGRINTGRARVVPAIAAVLFGVLVGASMLGLLAPDVAEAQTEPNTAANGVLLPPPDYDPAAARNEELSGSAVVPATPGSPVDSADPSVAADSPEAVAGAPGNGTSTTTSLGGADVAVSSVGGSYEVDRPSKRSERKN
jgi:hypothetical protein